ncbi:MAG: LysM peptidoglycan-binding domain-containing protein, partial [Bacteroidales bacterium]|nr:LysM peptidoglycan-binding domain-containing protein [Bacteroidales bacterium]
MKRFAIILLLSALALPVAAQDYQVPEIEISKDKVLVDGKPFFAHVVTAKQTLFSISKAYGVSVRDIVEANQKLDLEKRGLKIGDVLLIPDALSVP